MIQTIVTLKKGEGRTLKAGGMWVYDNEIASIMGSFENGDVIAVHDFDGYFMGYGFINTGNIFQQGGGGCIQIYTYFINTVFYNTA